jgi:hypothetical protein
LPRKKDGSMRRKVILILLSFFRKYKPLTGLKGPVLDLICENE